MASVLPGSGAPRRDLPMFVVAAHSNPAMADALTLGERTTEAHVGNALAKLGLTFCAVAIWVAVRAVARA